MAVYGGTSPEVFDELAHVDGMSFYGEDAHVSEVSDYLSLAIESSYNQLFQTVALEELSMFEESGAIVLYEDGKLESFKNKVIDWFKKTWAKIKQAYDKFLDKVDKMTKDFKKKMIEVLAGKDPKDTLNKFDDGKVYYRGYAVIPNQDQLDSNDMYSKKDTLLKNIDEVKKVKESFDAAFKADSEISPTKYREEMSAKYNKAITDLGGKPQSTAGELRSSIINKILGTGKNHPYTGKWIKGHYKEMVDYVCDYGAIKRAMKRSYKQDKDVINKMIDAVKKTKKEAPTKLYTEYCRKFISLNNAVMSANLQYITIKYSVYRAMVMKVITARITKPKVAKESAGFDGYSSQSDLVDRLFNW